MKIKKILGLIQVLCFAWMMFFIVPENVVNAASSIGLGDIGYVETRDVANGVELEYVMSTNNSGEQKAYTVEIDKAALTSFVTYGTYVNGGEKLSAMIAQAEAEYGKKVVAAINGDFYDTSNGVPTSIMIVNGRFVTTGTSPNKRPAIGFKEDGSVIYGTPSISMKLNDGTSDMTINYLNNDRKLNTTAIYLYSSDYGATTKNTAPGKEIVLNVTSGDLKLGSTINATVESIGSENSTIAPGKLVLSTASSNASKFDSLTVGKNVTITITDNKANEGWSDVVQAVGYNAVLAENGVLTDITSSDTAIHPRSAIGIKEDGTLVLFQVDGRQPGWSNGLSYKQIAEHLVNEKGAKTVVNLDGGGSSTLTVRLPGNQDTEILNSPSDGWERSNSNAILFFENETPSPTNELAYLHTYPNNLVILEGAKTEIVTKATDSSYFPVTTPTDLSYEVSAGLGTIDENGLFTARTGSGTGTITVSSGSISRTMNVTVVDSITNIIADKTYLSVSPGEEVEFILSAFKDGMPITASNSSFKWELSSPVLGTISDGVFKSASSSATGSIYISYKTFKMTIPVEVGKQPKMVSTFEDAVIGQNWTSIIENSGNGGTGKVSVNTDERFVKFGEKSLRIDYDFTRATGTTSVTAYQSGYLPLEGYPTHIGMWVYGDNQGIDVRMLLLDGKNAANYISFEVVKWEGWKYIEAPIPEGLPTPLKVKYPIRAMAVGGKPKVAGTLYFDNLRVVYGFRNDDVLSPQAKDMAPVNGVTVDNNKPTISMKVWDAPDVNGVLTGINKNSVKVWINGEQMNNVIINDNPDGTHTINYTPSALNPLRPGPQIVKMRVEDNYGNITFKEWQFFVSGSYAGVDGIVPDNEVIYAGDVFNYYITANQYEGFEKFEGTLNFNKNALEVMSIVKMDQNITLNSINLDTVNSTGTVDLVATGMNNLTQPDDKQLIRITFGTKEGFIGNSDSEIIFRNVKVTQTGYNTPTPFLLPSYEVKVNYRYILSYITSTVGKDITFKVTDDEMNPISNVSFEVTGQNITLTGKTDANGEATFSEFRNLAANASFNIKAISGSYYSETMKVTMYDSLGSKTPYQIVVSPSADASTSVNISWQTNLDTTNSVVKYRKLGDTAWIEVTDDITQPIHVVTNSVMREYLAHVVTLTGLSPNTSYEYMVGGVSSDATTMSSTYTFKTAPSEDISFLFLGDPQNTSASGYTVTKNLIDAAMQIDPQIAMMLIAGDVVDDVNMYSQWQGFESVLGAYTNKLMTAAATGNHDVIRNYSDPFKYAFKGPDNGVDVLGANYYFEAGSAIIAIIDTESPDAYDAQAEWLKNIMATTDKKFKIVLMHRSPYAANYNEPHIRDYWPNVFDEAKIDLVLSGHDHVYNSTTMFNGKKASSEIYGTTYVVGGSAGVKFYNSNNLSDRPWIDYLYDEDNPVYTTINISSNVLSLDTYAYVGGTSSKINSIEINKDLVKAETIEITDKVDNILAGANYQFAGIIKDSNENNFNGTINWSILEDVEGITIENGNLVVADTFNENVEITVVASFENVVTTYKVKVFGSLPTATEVIGSILDSQNNFFNDIYK